MLDLIEQDETEQPEQLQQATVYRKSQGHYWANLDGKLLRCAISNRCVNNYYTLRPTHLRYTIGS